MSWRFGLPLLERQGVYVLRAMRLYAKRSFSTDQIKLSFERGVIYAPNLYQQLVDRELSRIKLAVWCTALLVAYSVRAMYLVRSTWRGWRHG